MDEPLAVSDHLQQASDRNYYEEAGGQLHTGLGAGPSPRSAAVAAMDVSSPRIRELQTVADIQSKNLRWLLWGGVGATALYMAVGMVWFKISDKWTFTDTVYFAVMSLVTVGYGDIVVNDINEDRLIDTLLILLGLATLGIWVAFGQQTRRRRARSKGVEERYMMPPFDADRNIRKCWMRLVQSLVWAAVVIIVGVGVFMAGEDESFTTSFYWAVVTASTIGYGDVVPTTVGMKWFTLFYSIVASISMFILFRTVGAFPFRVWSVQAEEKVFRQFCRPAALGDRARVTSLVETAVAENLGVPPGRTQDGVSRSDFTLSMLLMLDRISYKDYVEVARVFDELGVGGEGGEGGVRRRPGFVRPKQ